MKTNLHLLPACLVCVAVLNARADDSDWVSLSGFIGAGAEVYASVEDGAGNLYVGGAFTLIGSTFANRVAKWDGNQWSALGTGLDLHVLSLAIMNGDVYAGGIFSSTGGVPASYIARWNGDNWSALGGGLDNSVQAIQVVGNDLYVCGDFTFATNSGGAAIRVNRVARWDGSTWSALGQGASSTCYAVSESGGIVYVGGAFSTVTNSGGVPLTVNSIAQWDGTNWSTVGGGVGHHLPPPGGASYVYKLANLGGNIYASGVFTYATNTGSGALRVNQIARWDGSSWSALGTGLNSWAMGLGMKDGNLYAGGGFTWATNTGGAAVSANRVAVWNGSNWSTLGRGLGNAVRTLVWRGEELIVGGDFTTTTNSGNQTVTVNRLARWNGSGWLAFGSGINNGVRAVKVSGSDLYVGGNFTLANNETTGNVLSRGVIKWSGGQWSGLGFGVNNNVNALALSGSNLYVGGNFTVATNSGGGTVNASRIARWNGVSWSGLSGGLNGLVEAVELSGSNVFVGGLFTVATNSGIPLTVNRVAQWNGSAWSALGLGLNGTVNALAVSGDQLYAGGIFTIATNTGGMAVTVNRIARWDGTNWSALGAGLGGSVGALLVSGNDLYAGANPGVVRWDGVTWTSLGLGLNGSATELAMSGGDLFACGTIAIATNLGGTVTVNRIARWDGVNWSAMGSGVNNTAWGLAVAGNDLYVGGDFSSAGGKLAFYLARAALNNTPAPLLILTTNGLSGFTNGQFRIGISGPAGSNVVIQASTNLLNWDSILTNPLNGGLLFHTDARFSEFPQQFYRALLE